MYNAYVTRLKNVRKHPNADRLQLAECFGNTVCIDLSYTEGQLGIYFPTDGQLSVEFAEVNNLLRKKDANGNQIGGYMDAEKRNVTAIRLRGEKSDGLFLPLSCLSSFGDVESLSEGDIINTFNGHEICKKYIPKRKYNNSAREGNRTRKKTEPLYQFFAEHVDTSQLAYNLHDFHSGDYLEVTLKMHGTSQRTAHLQKFVGYKRSLKDRLLGRAGMPVYQWDYVDGTRRTVLEHFDGGFYGSNAFRQPHADVFRGKLHKGEEVFYEVVGYVDTCKPIMPVADNKKLQSSEFVKQYGKTTTFSYGCENGQSELYVYRMTMTNEDGFVVEYPPDLMRLRCEQMGVKCVPVLWSGVIAAQDVEETEKFVKSLAELYNDGVDPIGKTHVREGVVIRIVNRPKFTAYKDKNFSFKVLEGIVKAHADAPDMEEAEDAE